MNRREAALLLVLGCLVVPAAQLLAKFGISKTRVTFLMHHPPAFVTPGRELRVDANSTDPRGTIWASQLKGLLDQNLIRENFKPTPTAPTFLQFTVNQSEATVENQRRVESVNVHTGSHTEYDKKGNAREVEDCQFQQAEMTYLVSNGSLSVTVQVSETKSQAVVHSQVLQPTYNAESAIAGPTRCGGQGYGVRAGQLQSPQAILSSLIEQAAANTLRLVAGYDEPRSVLLAVDGELKPGNAQALAGNWRQALETWKGASIKEKARDTEAARQYNLGVAHEALAASAMRNNALDEANAHLNDAEQSYRQALGLDPGEKYFRDTIARLQHDRGVLQKEQEHQFMKQAVEAASLPQAPQAPSQPLTVDIPLDGWPENESPAVHSFRAYVRKRIETQKQEPSEAFRKQLSAEGADYEVKEGRAMQVVDSEAKRFLVLKQNLDKYRELFSELAGDGVISADEREVLMTRKKTLHLPDGLVKQVEAQFRFKE